MHRESGIPELHEHLHCDCLHLALYERGRRHPVGALIERLQREVPWRAPLLVAGDFNDWRNLAGRRLADHWGRPARSFPSAFPVLRLDRIYVRGFRVSHTEIHRGPSWSRLSDHAALSAHLQLE